MNAKLKLNDVTNKTNRVSVINTIPKPNKSGNPYPKKKVISIMTKL